MLDALYIYASTVSSNSADFSQSSHMHAQLSFGSFQKKANLTLHSLVFYQNCLLEKLSDPFIFQSSGLFGQEKVVTFNRIFSLPVYKENTCNYKKKKIYQLK